MHRDLRPTGISLQYQTYDVTDMLNDRNELLAVVGGGWAVGSFTYKRRNRVYAKRQALLGELRILYTDGTGETIGTNEEWGSNGRRKL